MSTIKSSAEHLTLNADGASKDIKFQANGVEKASISSSGAFTSTTIDATKLTGNLPAVSGASLTALNASNLGSGTVPTARLGSGTASSSTFLRGDSTYAEAGGGKILQVVSMQTNTNNGVSDATWTATAATLAITPSSTSSKVMVMFTGGIYIQNTSGDGGYAARFQQAIAGGATTYPAELGSNTNTNYTVYYTSEAIGQKNHYLNLHGIVSPNTTAAITYTFYIINHNANSVGLNGFPTKAVLTLMEIAG